MAGQPSYAPLRVAPTPELPIAKMVIGMRVEEAADLLPRLFNLCRVAQGLAARAAFDLPLPANWQVELRQEILREHVMKLCLKWPAVLSLPTLDLPRDWMANPDALRGTLFGAQSDLPETSESYEAFLAYGEGIAPVLAAIRDMFPKGIGNRSVLPTATHENVFSEEALENSVASRHAEHPVLAYVEQAWGRGPFWSATAVAYDVQSIVNGHLPEARLAPDRAVVPAARGFYGVTARIENGHVAAFARVTPTDHMLAPGGMMEQSLSSLPTETGQTVAPCLMAILDPCYPIRLEQAVEREQAYA